MDQVKPVIGVLADFINIGYKIMHGGGIWQILGLSADLSVIQALDKNAFLAQLKALSTDDRKALIAEFKHKLSLADVVLQGKIDAFADDLEGLVELGFHTVALYEEALVVANKFKAIFQ